MSGHRDYFLEDDPGEKGTDLRLLRRLLAYLKPHLGLAALSLAGLVLGTACQLAGPYLVKLVIDGHLAPRIFTGILPKVGLYLLSLAGASAFLFLQMYAVSLIGQRVILDLRDRLFRHLQRLPVAFFDRMPTGRLMTRLTSDVEALQELIASGLVSTVGDVAVLIGTAAVLLWMDARLALVAFAVLPALLLFVELLKKSIREANREMRRRLARMNAFLQEHVSGIAVVKAFVREDRTDRRFDGLNDDYAAVTVRLTNFYSIYFPGVEFLSSVAVGLLLWRGGLGIVDGTITLGTLVAFLEYVQKFFNPLKDMSDKYGILQSALASCERIFRILDTPESPEYGERGNRDVPAEGGTRGTGADGRGLPAREAIAHAAGVGGARSRPPAIEFRDVWFSYGYGRPDGREGGGEPVLKGVTFILREGEAGAIVGATGAGKTTILHLLIRLYEVSRGRILVDGQDIREIPREELRGRFSLVQQDPFLFSGSILSNVEAGGSAIGHAVEATGVAAFAGGWEEGLMTDVGERGGRLSAGQRQLVAFARALAREPRVLLLDEATSSVDPVTEHAIREGIGKILAGRTSLVVAHRLSTILSADRILVLHKGRIREEGNHRELMERNGIYRRLHALQFDEGGGPG